MSKKKRVKGDRRSKNKQVLLSSKIDWKKAAELFARVDTKVPNKKLKASDVLKFLAKAADDGLMFIAHADDPAIVEYSLFGTGPLTWETNRMVKRFQKQNFVTVQENPDGSTVVKITKNGMTRALAYQLNTLKLKKERWDNKWRVVIFDVPEKYKSFRDLFRMRLRQLGLYPLQESVFVSPYKCFDEIEFLRELYRIAFTVRYLLVEKIEDDDNIRLYFNL